MISDEDLRHHQIIKPLERQQEEQKEMEIQLQRKKSIVKIKRSDFKQNAKQLYLGRFQSNYREQPWNAAQKQATIDLLTKWKQ